MRPGDLVLFTCIRASGQHETAVGILLSSRVTKWDSKVTFYTLLTPAGLREVILGGKGTKHEVLT